MDAKTLAHTKRPTHANVRLVDRRRPERVLGVVLWLGLVLVLYACGRLA